MLYILSYEEINNYCSNYKIENGKIVNIPTNQVILDEEIILKVKSSILIYKEAYNSYNADLQQFGRTSKSKQEYISKTMEKFGVNGEENTYGINKLINSLLSSNGHYEEMMSGNDLVNSKFSILVGAKKDYGLAYLKLKFREKGLDIENLQIRQDLTELQHNGVSKVIIDFKLKEYKKDKNVEIEQSTSKVLFPHPKSNELNELEKQKKIAKQNNDDVAYNYAQSNIERIIRKTPVAVTPEQWNSMNIEQQLSFIQLKMNEAKILDDKDTFDYWNSNFINLQQKKNSISVYEYHAPLYDTSPSQSNINEKLEQTEFTLFVNQLREQTNKVSAEYKVILSDGYIDDQELALLIGRTNELISNADSLKHIANNQREVMLLNSIIDMLHNEQNKMITMQNGTNKTEEAMRKL